MELCYYTSVGYWSCIFESQNSGFIFSNRFPIDVNIKDWGTTITKIPTDIQIQIPDECVAFVSQQTQKENLKVSVGVIDSNYRGPLILVVYTESPRESIQPHELVIRLSVRKLFSILTFPQLIYNIEEECNTCDCITELFDADEDYVHFSKANGEMLDYEELDLYKNKNAVRNLLVKTPTRDQVNGDLYKPLFYKIKVQNQNFNNLKTFSFYKTSGDGELENYGGFYVKKLGYSENYLFLEMIYKGSALKPSVSETFNVNLDTTPQAITCLEPYTDTFGAKRQHDAGHDIICHCDFQINHGKTVKIIIPQKLIFDDNIQAYVFGKSSLNARGLVVAPCQVKSGRYLTLTITNVSGTKQRLVKSEKIAQLILIEDSLILGKEDTTCYEAETFPDSNHSRFNVISGKDCALWKEVENIDCDTDRGCKGFGSTGKFINDRFSTDDYYKLL